MLLIIEIRLKRDNIFQRKDGSGNNDPRKMGSTSRQYRTLLELGGSNFLDVQYV